MEIVSTYSQIQEHEDRRTEFPWQAGNVYDLLVCPTCSGVTLRKYFFHDAYDPDEIEPETLYPAAQHTPVGLPDEIGRAYEAAHRVRDVDANAYGVLIGRLLEFVCEDRSAQGNSLAAKLSDLASKHEIPQNLVDVANNLRHLRNIGAHPSLGTLTHAEISIVDQLCNAILEYVYSAPFIAGEAQRRLEQLKHGSSSKESSELIST